jgi:hypothetical protein
MGRAPFAPRGPCFISKESKWAPSFVNLHLRIGAAFSCLCTLLLLLTPDLIMVPRTISRCNNVQGVTHNSVSLHHVISTVCNKWRLDAIREKCGNLAGRPA